MDWQAVLTSLITSGIVVSAFTFTTQRRTKNIEFNYDYRKYILERRKWAYEKVEEVFHGLEEGKGLSEALLFTISTDDEKFTVLNSYAEILNKVLVNKVWYSEELTGKLIELNVLVQFERARAIGQRSGKDEPVKRIIYFYKIFQELIEIYFLDITRLDKIDEFTRAKIKFHNKLYRENQETVSNL